MTEAHRVCPACRRRQDAWLDSRPQQIFAGERTFILNASAAYDLTPGGVAERRRARWARWRALVVEQIAGIAADCRRAGHVAVAS